MMKLQITTFVLIGLFVGFLTDGPMLGVLAATVVFIAYKLEKYLDEKNPE